VNLRRALALALPALAGAVALAGCGAGGETSAPTIQQALTTHAVDFEPSGPVAAGKPVTVSFRIVQPSGDKLVTMKRFRTGSGPHTGVHMIIVRDDLGAIIHRHPPMNPDGTFDQQITFPTPGKYRVVLDVYPASGPAPNFQLIDKRAGVPTITVKGPHTSEPLPPPSTTTRVDGYTFTMTKVVPSKLRAIEPALISMTVTDPQGKPVTLTPWYGALAHAIFFHQGRFEYFHTHVCSPGAGGCTSVLAGSKVTGSSSTPGKLTVGVILPDSGTWRLFLQMKDGTKVLTAPFTLRVAA
jgi:hypothetical protein